MRTEQKIAIVVVLTLLTVIAILADAVRQRTVQIEELQAEAEAAKWDNPMVVKISRYGPILTPSWVIPLRDDDGNLILSSAGDTIWRFED